MPQHASSPLAPAVKLAIIGAQKSGTSALAAYLAEHLDVCIAPDKEPHFFDSPAYQSDWDTEERERHYLSRFPNFRGETILCDATPSYLFLPWVAQRMYNYNPRMKLIVLLRDPVQRAFAQYFMDRHRGWERLGLPWAFLLEPLRAFYRQRVLRPANAGERYAHTYLSRGRYLGQLRNWLRYFPREQFLFLRHEDLYHRHEETLGRVYHFIGLPEPRKLPEHREVLRGSYDPGRHRLLRALLRQYYRRDIEGVQELLGLDLSSWLRG
jgi:hypothetical protein